jgi:hypothetical protein
MRQLFAFFILCGLLALIQGEYLPEINVVAVFGTGRATTTDTVGLNGEINAPIDSIYDPTENYLYLTDQNGGGLIRKLAVTNQYSAPYSSIYFVKTVFVGKRRV